MKLNLPTVGPILGYTTASQTRIWFRGHFEATGESSYRRCFGLLRWRRRGAAEWSLPLFNKMSPNFDMSCVLCPTDLAPDTAYEYQVGWIHLDAELDSVSALQAGLIEWPPQTHAFKTGAADAAAPRSFVVGSCRYLLRTFIGEIFDDRGDKIFRSILAQHEARPVDGMLMIGDQIYADDLRTLEPDRKLPEFLRRYRTVFSQPHIRSLMATVPTYMILDDHEIEDNWPAKATTQDRLIVYPNAIHAYQIYQCSHSPLFELDGDGRIDGTLQKFWYSFSDGCADWFVMDSRTERVLGAPQRRMVKREQLQALLQWLGEGKGRVKLVVTSVPFAPDLEFDGEDKWGAFPEQRTAILERLAELPAAKVVFVSGDVHCSFTAEIRMKGRRRPLAYQVVASSFFWPYPHMHKGEFVQDKPLLSTDSAGRFSARISSEVYSEDNFARFDVSDRAVAVQFFKRRGDALGEPFVLRFA